MPDYRQSIDEATPDEQRRRQTHVVRAVIMLPMVALFFVAGVVNIWNFPAILWVLFYCFRVLWGAYRGDLEA
jgi:hypothetical protein